MLAALFWFFFFFRVDQAGLREPGCTRRSLGIGKAFGGAGASPCTALTGAGEGLEGLAIPIPVYLSISPLVQCHQDRHIP